MTDLEELAIYYETRRGVGHTWAMLHGAINQKSAIVVVSDDRARSEFSRAGIDRNRIITVLELEKLRGHDNPLVIDHHALVKLLHGVRAENDRLRYENSKLRHENADLLMDGKK